MFHDDALCKFTIDIDIDIVLRNSYSPHARDFSGQVECLSSDFM